MNNVFDLIEDFYAQDPEWNNVLRQRYAEDFLRLKSWQGASEEELRQTWDYISELCLYLGNADNFLGDMNREDFIDCVGWCCRNISDFIPTAKFIAGFLDAVSELFAHLQKKKIISNAEAPQAAKAKLIVKGKLQLINKDGSFADGCDRYNQYATPDLPNKIYLNIGERLDNLINFMQQFYNDKKYRRDIERANFLFSGILAVGVEKAKMDNDEYSQIFWDYFLFDYRMLKNDKTPVQNFYDTFKVDSFSEASLPAKHILGELLQTRLVLFEVLEQTPEGLYSCRNILTGETYVLMLPIDENAETDGFIFLGHIFYNDTMMMNCIRGMLMNKASRKRFLSMLDSYKDWFSRRYLCGIMSWDDFISRNPIFIRHISMLYAAFIRLDAFTYTTDVDGYVAQPITNDAVSLMLWDMMHSYAFSAYDIFLAKTMWSDYLASTGMKETEVQLSEVWAAGIIYNFVKLNDVYTYDLEQISLMCYGLSKTAITRAAEAVKTALKLEKHDPRYVNEEGLLLMLLQ